MKLNGLEAKRNSDFYTFARHEKYDVKYSANAVSIILPSGMKKLLLKPERQFKLLSAINH